MARFKKCTEKDISILLETNSDSDAEEFDESYIPKKDNHSSDSSDSDKIFDDNRSLLLRSNALQKEQASLRLKLRRSTEQSMYKIDTESEDERPRRSTRNTKYYLKGLQNENQISRKGTRIIKLPKRYSDYECFTSKLQVPVLHRDQINYNEKELLLASLDTINERVKNNNKHAIKNDDFDDSDCICVNFNSRMPFTQLSTMSKSNKRSNVCCIDDINVDTSEVTGSKFSKHISVDEESKKDNVVQTLLNEKIPISKEDTIQYASLDNTPRRPSIEKSGRKNILIVSNKCRPVICKDESKSKVDEIKIVDKVAKSLSIKTKQKNKNIKNIAKSSIIQNGLSTPKSHRVSLKHNILTPSVKKRTEILIKQVTPLQQARIKLHVNAVPKSLPCREEQFNNIYTFLEGRLMDNIGGCIYISGVPGTGKTATVNEIIKCLKRSVDKGKLNYFNFVEINGMKLSEPRQAYVQILKQLSGKVLTWEQAYNVLEKRFNSSVKRPMTLLLVDELDLLCTKRQDVIYNLLDWPAKVSAHLIVITIANTMDLPERVLMGRVTSRLGLTRIIFQPYNHKQLQEIILTRLKDIDTFKSEAIQLIARKVSAVSGDARRALDICRRAAEITETRDSTIVTIENVNEALSEMITNPKVQVIRHCSKFEQIFLQAVRAEVTRTGVEEICFINAYRQFESLCFFDGHETPNITQMLDICTKLSDYRLLIQEYSSSDIHQKILLNVSKDAIHYALQISQVDFD